MQQQHMDDTIDTCGPYHRRLVNRQSGSATLIEWSIKSKAARPAQSIHLALSMQQAAWTPQHVSSAVRSLYGAWVDMQRQPVKIITP
jgi:hypothetical protein